MGRLPDRRGQIRSVPTAGGRIREIAVGFGAFEISPDGSRIIYGNQHVVYSVPVASGAPVTKLFDEPTNVINTFDFTGDGTRVFSVINGPGNDPFSANLWSAPVDGGVPVKVNPTMPTGQGVEYAQASPDGQWIAYTGDQDTNNVSETYVAPSAGGESVRTNTGLPAATYYANNWSADSRFLGVRANVGGAPADLYSWGVADHVNRPMTTGPSGHLLTTWATSDDSVISVVTSGTTNVMRRVRFDGTGSTTLTTTTGTISIKNVFRTNVVFTDTASSSLLLQMFDGTPAKALQNLNALTTGSVTESGGEDRVFWVDGDTKLHSTAIPGAAAVGGTINSGNLAVQVAHFTTGTRPLPYLEDGVLKITDPAATNSTVQVVAQAATAKVKQAVGTPDGRRVVYLIDSLVDETYNLYVAQPFSFDIQDAAKYVPLTPFRALDTRADGPQLRYTGPKPVAGQTVQLNVRDLPGVEASTDLRAVVLNVAATNTDGPGYVTVYPNGQPRPLASSLNLTGAGQTRPNLVTVQVGPDGIVNLYTLNGTDLVVDVEGFYRYAVNATDGRFFPLPPARLLDTRADGPQVGFVGAKPGIGGSFDLQVRGRGGVPASGVAAVVMNVAATEASADGFVTVWPTGQPRPLAANLNLVTGQTISNQVIVPVGADGKVSFFTQSGTHLVADIAGWFTNTTEGTGSSGLFVPTAPVRMLDTRADGPQVGYTGVKPGPGSIVPVQWKGLAYGVSAVVMNVTITETPLPGFVTAWPNGRPRPLAANVNAAANDTIGNHSTVKVGQPDQFAQLFTSNGGHLIADVVGHYTG